ncbi:heterokaryon incompatibility protein-domain-containing protein, partial [Geopyxis carbonaria]
YAILSHRWLSEDVDLEILHGELQKAQKVSRVRNGPAKDKIVNILQVAKSHELQPETIWLDTCCIDKTNSTELNEALSCMGEWYAGASVCIAFLADSSATCLSEVENTEWATRGWTLQEIVMCTRVTFYNCYWEKIGDSMEDPIVDIRHLGRLGPKLLPCQGQKASKNPASTIFHGASTRRTTREEDEAYSLLGMLGISIPISYGEGRSRAMIRLINEVVTTTGDLSVFNWTGLDAGNKLP